MDSYDIFKALYRLDLLKNSPEYWWPNAGEFEVVISAVLTQQTKWSNVENSLANLDTLSALSFEGFLALDITTLAQAIKPSGFFNQKSKRLYDLARAIQESFFDFETFSEQVSREWLLEQKGISFETADSILCYALMRETLVVDNYTKKLLFHYGYEFEYYDELQDWLKAGVYENFDKIIQLYGAEKTLHEVYCDFHGMIVEFCKSNCKNIDLLGL